MPHYHKLGKIPPKRHIIFRKPNGDLYAEQVVSTEGFSDLYSVVYHLYPPTRVLKIDKHYSVMPEIAYEKNMQNRSFKGFNVEPENDYIKSRKPILVNSDVHISLAAPKNSIKEYYFKNSSADEMIFVHKGKGTLRTMYGNLEFSYGDHLVIPRGTIYQMEFNTIENRLFIGAVLTVSQALRSYISKDFVF